ncbi:hypothetical protein VCR4J5_1760012 [Vibrio crassostreae]|uniref:Uncharacterized protein n=1 Tax=Vibrio crassostreae TaxID=246167 RepID=A0A822MXY3_9VIBR|nr:hypothetical protein VCRA2116O26_390015 [Vibrio crassostreae]CAK2063381.1 hypothetical protein VCRA2113O22_390015 [Vibrio crassostreae]CAK2066057.1 hypothetical protein VCRA2117O38_390022 [Vibrio crassostreae]CAK2073012.1 hypothetical protein VCRA2116O27_380022 [Vibrio crassostreae]CAK2109895.1 hypothetical protein VCRA2118O41_400022 [Vibrio crassostreae]
MQFALHQEVETMSCIALNTVEATPFYQYIDRKHSNGYTFRRMKAERSSLGYTI